MSRCMRTTLSIDDDIAAMIERMRRARDVSLKELVNEALRRGLRDMGARTKRPEPFTTRSVDAGAVRIASIDNVSEALAAAEDETFK